VIDLTAIDQQLEEARKNIKNFETLEADQFFLHFSLGHLNRDESLLFLAIHTKHHLEIVRDIVG